MKKLIKNAEKNASKMQKKTILKCIKSFFKAVANQWENIWNIKQFNPNKPGVLIALKNRYNYKHNNARCKEEWWPFKVIAQN